MSRTLNPLTYLFMLAGLLAAASFMASSAYAQQGREIALNASDLSSVSRIVTDGNQDAALISHPLHKADFEGEVAAERIAKTKALYAYESVYQFSAFTESETSVFIANWLYEYESAADAKVALQEFEQTMLGKLTNLGQFMSVRKGIAGDLYYIQGGEGDDIYWLVGLSENTIALYLVNGFGQEAVRNTLSSLLGLVERQ